MTRTLALAFAASLGASDAAAEDILVYATTTTLCAACEAGEIMDHTVRVATSRAAFAAAYYEATPDLVAIEAESRLPLEVEAILVDSVRRGVPTIVSSMGMGANADLQPELGVQVVDEQELREHETEPGSPVNFFRGTQGRLIGGNARTTYNNQLLSLTTTGPVAARASGLRPPSIVAAADDNLIVNGMHVWNYYLADADADGLNDAVELWHAEMEYLLGTGPRVTVVGSCPGTLSVDMDGFAPNARVITATSAAVGTTPVPSGPCVGVELDLDSAGLRVIASVKVDDEGRVSFQAEAPAEPPAALIGHARSGRACRAPRRVP